ncbi:uncharacterized protein [Cherax quadricarinatus]|uniref:uncharacterized protein n=1 Tax=Cherax quadricarinatus TaxID=27406 RepID=UPI00387EA69F
MKNSSPPAHSKHRSTRCRSSTNKYNMQDLRSALKAAFPTMYQQDASLGLDPRLALVSDNLEAPEEISQHSDGGATSNHGCVNGASVALSKCDPQSYTGVVHSAVGNYPQGQLSEYDSQGHPKVILSASGWDPQEFDDSVCGRNTGGVCLGLRVSPSPPWQDDDDYLRMVDPNDVLPLESQSGSSSSSLHDLSASSSDSLIVDPRETMPETAHSSYHPDTIHPSGCMLGVSQSGYVPGTVCSVRSSANLLGVIPKTYPSNLQERTPSHSKASVLEGVTATRPVTRKGYRHRFSRKYLPDGEEKEQRKRNLNNIASKVYREKNKTSRNKLPQELKEEQEKNEMLKLDSEILKEQITLYRTLISEQLLVTQHMQESPPDTA